MQSLAWLTLFILRAMRALFSGPNRCLIVLWVSMGSGQVAIAENADDACYHNNIRNALSYGITMNNLGEKLNKPYNFAAQNRPSTPLPLMVNNTGLKNSAASVASSCNFVHSGMPGVGENLFAGTEITGTSQSEWESNRVWRIENAIHTWADEARLLSYPVGAPTVGCNNGLTGVNCRAAIGHYTQMVWDNTTQVGCAEQFCPSGITSSSIALGSLPSTMLVCHYSPQGNYVSGANYLGPYSGSGVQSPAASPPSINTCYSGSSSGGSGFVIAPILLLLDD